MAAQEESCTFVRPTHLTIPHNIQQPDNVRSPRQVLENLNLPLDLLLLDRFQDFHDAFLVGRDVNGFKHLDEPVSTSKLISGQTHL